ncbi:unnamed protein product [Paramecium octaurelia]|uniref:Uncharacterized protein n=1 Tax=Paramecium octaurelia TaxID=43137 RepID=A0A8S1W5G4_PAROT|nr:unnamed protein product [Paramecium octaurelia]
MQIEQSMIVDGQNIQQLSDISKCLLAIPDLININLTFLNISQFTYSAKLNNQINSDNKFNNSLTLTESQKNYDSVLKQQLNAESQLYNNLQFTLLQTNKKSQSPKSIQTDKQKELINCSRNSQIGIKFKKSDGLLSNQIFNSKIQSAPLTAPFSARNSIIMCQSEIQSSNDQKMSDQSYQHDKYRWIHTVPQNIINKNQQTPSTQKGQKQRYFVQDYSSLHPNPYYDPIYIQNHFQTNGQINTNIKYQKNKIRNLNQNVYQSQNSNQNSGFKLLTKQQKASTISNKPKDGHIIITLPQSKKKFDSVSQKQRQQTKSLDQIKINDHFKRLLSTQESRELYAKPFFYAQYSQILKVPVQSSSEKYIQTLYKPVTKQRIKQRGDLSLEQNKNYSYDQPQQQQYYSDDSFEGKTQNIKKVDLYELAQERQSNQDLMQNNSNFKSQENCKNQQQESPTQNSQYYQMALQSSQYYQNSNDVEEQNRNSNIQEYSNFHYFQDNNQFSSQIQQNPFAQTSKKPIQIKLNIKEFIASEQQQKSSPMSSNLYQQKISNQKTHR